MSYGLLPALIKKFRTLYSDMRLELKELILREQISALKARTIDIGILRLPLLGVGDFETKVNHREWMVAVLPAEHLLAEQKTVILMKLSAEPFLMFSPERVLSLHAKTLLACHDTVQPACDP